MDARLSIFFFQWAIIHHCHYLLLSLNCPRFGQAAPLQTGSCVLLTVPVLVSLSCHTDFHRQGGLGHRSLFFVTVVEAGHLGPGHQHDWVLVSAFFPDLLMAAFSLCAHKAFPRHLLTGWHISSPLWATFLIYERRETKLHELCGDVLVRRPKDHPLSGV